MTPRQADVVFVLEGLPGVLGIYALGPSAGEFEFAVGLEHGPRFLVGAHYALLRVLSHEECHRVLFFETQLPPGIDGRAVRLELSGPERDAARGRVPPMEPVVEPPQAPKRLRSGAPFAALIVDSDVEVYRSVATALGTGARRVIESDPVKAVERALAEEFDLILSSARVAFGRQGFLARLQREDSVVASRVVILAALGERGLVTANLDELGCLNTCLSKPLDPETLLAIARTGCVFVSWTIPIPRVRTEPGRVEPNLVTRNVLIIDDDVGSRILGEASPHGAIKVFVTEDPWDALDHIATAKLDLVLCSASMRTGRTPLYRLLWGAHPELKSRFALIVPRDGAPLSAKDGRERAVVERPLTPDVLKKALARFGRG